MTPDTVLIGFACFLAGLAIGGVVGIFIHALLGAGSDPDEY